MKKVFSWIDAQMKQAALLSKEEQELSVWYYLSQLEPLPSVEKESSAEQGSTSLVELEQGTDRSDFHDDEDLGLDLADYLDDDELELDLADYLDDEDVGLDQADDLDVDDLGLDQKEYLDDEDSEIETPSMQEEESNNLLDVRKDGSGRKTAPFFVRKYIAASSQPSIVEEEKRADLTGEPKMRVLVHVLSQKSLQIQFLSAYLNPYWENTFPAPFSLLQWLNEFTGEIDVTYHSTFTIHLDSGPVTEENFIAFTKIKNGRVKIGIPLKALLYYTWRFSFDEKGRGNEKRLIYLIGERLERQEFNQLMEPERKQVILIGTDQDSLVRQKERISKIPSVSHVHLFTSLSFYDLYLYMNVNEGTEKAMADGAYKRKINLPVYLRMKLNNWAEQGQTEEKLKEIISEAITVMCNEWWLENSPEDILLMKKIVKVSVCYQTNVKPALKKIYKENKRNLTHFKNKEYDTKQGFFLQIENALLPIAQLLNEELGVSE